MKRKTKEAEKQIETTQANTYKFRLTPDMTPQGLRTNITNLKYKTLLQGKIADKELEEDILSNPIAMQLLLKKRTVMTIAMRGTEGNAGALEIIGILPEDEVYVQEYFMNRKIGSNGWLPALEGFKNMMDTMAKPILGIRSILAPSQETTITEINGAVSFK